MEFYLSLIIVAALLVIGARTPGVLLGGVLFTYQLGSLSHLPWIGTAYIAAATLISIGRYSYRPHKLEIRASDWGALVIVMLSILSISWSFDPGGSESEALALTLSVTGMFGVARLSPLDHGKSVRAMIWTIAIVSPLVSILMLNVRATAGWAAKARLLIENSDATAVGLSQPFASCLLACSMLLLMRVPAWQKGLIVGAMATVAYTAIASGTRSVFLAYGVGMAVFFALSLKSINPSRLLQGILALAVASSILLFFSPIEDLAQSVGRMLGVGEALGDDASSRERLAIYSVAWDQFQQHPLQGVGDGALIVFGQFRYPHNMELEIIAEFGIIGLLIFGFWFLSVFREASYVRSRDPETGAILIGFLVVVLVQHQVSFSISMARTLFLVVALLAAYGSGYRLAAKKRRPSAHGLHAGARPPLNQSRAWRAYA